MSKKTAHFIPLSSLDEPIYMRKIENFFEKHLSLIYGPQQKAIDQIKKNKDRICEIMFTNKDPLGFLVYKKDLQCEFVMKEAFELKALALFDSEKKARRGLGSLMCKRLEFLAKNKNAKCIFCTINIKNKETINFFTHMGYKIIGEKSKMEFYFLKTL